MSSRKTKRRDSNLSIWERSEPETRPAPQPLTRREIVGAAIRIADEDGIGAVSVRNVAAALKSGPMRLYPYIGTKAELLDLMADTVYSEMIAAGPFDGDWRDVLSAIASRLRQAAQRHGWFVDLIGLLPHQGPGALAFIEASHASLGRTTEFSDIDQVMRAVRLVFAYAVGAIGIETGEARVEREEGVTKAEWQFANSGYLLRAIGNGRFPTLARIVTEHTHPTAANHFDDGLKWLLDGVAANLYSNSGRQ